ncbi:MAG: long-chain fatty acid--CoA ligase [bacterium]|nr:long-chain fatty acid--CoA ligase [bacterium]
MLVDALLETSDRYADRLAVADHATKLTYGRLVKVAAALRGIVLKETRSERVGICLPACALFPAVLFGVWWAGKKAVPLNFLLADEELEHVIRDAELDVVFSVKYFKERLGKLPVRSIMLEDLPIKRRVLTGMFRRRPAGPRPDADDTAVILYTSGTSHVPKGVELTFDNLRSNCADSIASARFTGEHRFLNILPPFHVFGLTGNVLIPIVLGCTVFSLPRFNAATVLAKVREHGISVLLATPSMYGALMRVKSPPPDVLASLYLNISGGEPLPAATESGCRERLGAKLLQGYGLTETSPVVSLCVPHSERSGTVGQPIENTRVRIVDEAGRDTPTGEPGEVWIQGPGVMKGYFRNPEETRAVITPDGWFKSGDIGTLDDEGFLSITGRKKEMIIVGGENVFPSEIETVLAEHPAVTQVAVIGVSDASRGEVPIAFVCLEEGAEASPIELRQFARDRLAGHKVPREVLISADLPLGPTGKILKRKLCP